MFHQTLETLIVTPGNDNAFRVIFISKSNMATSLQPLFDASSVDLWRSGEAVSQLGFEVERGLYFPDGDPTHSIEAHIDLLPYLVAAVTLFPQGEAVENVVIAKQEKEKKGEYGNPGISEERLVTYRQLVNDDRIPIMRSPLELSSILKIIKDASGVEIGATVGFFVGWGTPYLLITVPAGMLLCSAASGIARAMEKGLEKLLRQWLA